MFDYLIIGAGFAGSVIAERIATVLNRKVLVIEKRSHIGGNCYDYRTKEGIIVHKYGPHLFHTNYEKVWRYLSNFTQWHLYQHEVLASVDGKKIPIPFNLNSLYEIFPLYLAKKLEEKLLDRYNYGARIPILELKNTDDQDLKSLSNYIYERVFVNYTAKQWGMKLEDIDSEVTARVPVVISRDNRYFTDKYQGVPVEGYTKIFEKMLFRPNIKLMLNTDFKEVIKIDMSSKKIYLFEQEFKGKLIFTGMIDELFEYKFGELPYRSLDLKSETIDTEYFQEVATVNYPNNYDFTRITEFKYIHPVSTKETVILKEYPKSCNPDKDIPYYPIFTKKNLGIYSKYKKLINNFKNFILVGRLAEYKYYDMDDVIKRALEIFEEEIK